MRSSTLRALILVFPLAQAACVDNAVHEQTVQKLEETRRALAVKDTEIRAYQWQLASVAQQIQETQARSDAREKELHAQMRELAAASAALGERLKKVEIEGAVLAAAPPPAPGDAGRDARPGVRPEELRRLFAAADARNALVLEQLARIERLLSGGAGAPGLPAAGVAPGSRQRGPQPPPAEILDPWNFGSRK
jgi:hypothetical protein